MVVPAGDVLPPDLADVKARLQAEVQRRAGLLVDVSHRIHAHPELGYEERFAHDLLTGVLESEGLSPQRSAFGLDTAFVARAGSRGPTVAVLCEYDALPGLGHGCGHNIIAAAGLGAGLAAAALAEEVGGRVVILGTPAEEGGGGKIRMARQGAFEGVDAAMMVHPADADLAAMDVIAVHECEVRYCGLASHAAAAPQRGRNALDAAVLGYQAVAALRQHIRADERIHGIITDGGDKPNIVPHRAGAQWMVRSGDLASLALLEQRVLACLQAGADAAGCTMEVTWRDVTYADMLDSAPIVDAYIANAASLGRAVAGLGAPGGVMGSTDMGNVSYLVPSIHPMIRVSPPQVAIHTEAFESCAADEAGDRAVIDGAVALAWTIADCWLQPGLLARARAEHAAALAAAGGAQAQQAALK
jgi:amidohydrolase